MEQELILKNKLVIVSSVLFFLIFPGYISQAVGGKRGATDFTEEINKSSSPQKKRQTSTNSPPHSNTLMLSQSQLQHTQKSISSAITPTQDRKNERRVSQRIPFPQSIHLPQPSFIFNPPASEILSKDDDEIFNDPTFLTSVQKIEEDHIIDQKESSPLIQKMLQTTFGVNDTKIIAVPNNDDFFLDPLVLSSLEKAEKSYLSQKALQTSPKESSDEVHTKLLNTFEEHQDHLFVSIKKAKKSILMTSHNFSASLKSQRKLFEALREASLRKVKVYLYFNKGYRLNDEEIDFLEKTGIKLSNPTVHSKLLVIDKNLITCGSFDWLSSARSLEDEYFLMETSFALKGPKAKTLIETFYRTIK